MFFIATPDGIPNVYRTELSSGRTTRITNVLSGVSGITPLTPALSVAAAAPNVVGVRRRQYNIYATTDKEAGGAAATALNAQNAAVLPPVTRRQSEMDVALMLQNPAQGLPETEYPAEDYSPARARHGDAADRWRGRGSLGGVCRRRHRVHLERHARQPSAGRDDSGPTVSKTSAARSCS